MRKLGLRKVKVTYLFNKGRGVRGKHSTQLSLTPECKLLTMRLHCLCFKFYSN